MSDCPAHLRPRVTHPSVERFASGVLIDSGEWEQAGVTHWHLARTEWRMNDPERFSEARVRRARLAGPDDAARSPHEVVAWLAEQAPKDAYADELTFWYAMRGQDCHRLHRLGASRIAHVDAYATTKRCCRPKPPTREGATR